MPRYAIWMLPLLLLFPMTAAFGAYDPIEVLGNHNIYSNGVTYNPSNAFDVEFSKLTGVYRIHGLATTGESYAVYLKQHDPDFSKVFFFKNGLFQKAELREIPQTAGFAGIIPETETILETTKPTLDFDVFISSPVLVQRDLSVKVNAFNTNPTDGKTRYGEPLEGVKFKVTLAQERKEYVVVNERTSYQQIVTDDWKTMRAFEGTSNKFGTWTGSQLLTSGVFSSGQHMLVTITASLGDQVVEKSEKIFVTEVGYK